MCCLVFAASSAWDFSLLTELTHPPISAGQRVLELGCGAGLLGVILHRADAAAVCLTDGDAQALHNCRHNLHINGAQVCIQSLNPLASIPGLGSTPSACPQHSLALHAGWWALSSVIE